jgi:hypothetical protein
MILFRRGINMKKICTSCGIEKDLEDFYRHDMMKDGHLNKCKDCVKSRVKSHRAANIEKIREYDRLRGRTEERKLKNKQRHDKMIHEVEYKNRIRAAKGKYVKKYRDRTNARRRLAYALYIGKVKRPDNCEKCGEAIQHLHAHHADYSKPLEVIWLCPKCHGFIHQR